jgi:pantothenate kinase
MSIASGDPLAGLSVIDCTSGELVERARRLVVPGRRRILGLTGSPGAGKSTVARQIVDALGPATAVLVPMDGFHLADVVLQALGRRDRKGAHDTFDDAGYAALMVRLHAADPDETVYAPDFRRDLEEPIGSAIPVPPDVPLVVTEGNYLLLDRARWPRARAVIDEVWFLAPDEAVRQDRLVRRHVSYGRSPQAARDWALGTDQRNADLIASTAARADVVLRVR